MIESESRRFLPGMSRNPDDGAVEKPVRILYITDSSFLGGDTRSEVWLLERLDKRRFSITAFTGVYGPTMESVRRIDGIRHVRREFGTADRVFPELQGSNRMKSAGLFLKSLRAVATAAWRTNPDIVFAGDRTRPMIAAQVAARISHALLVFHPQFFFAPRIANRWLRRKTALAADLVIGNSRFTTQSYGNVGVPYNKLLNADNGIDAEHFSPAPSSDVRDRFGIPEDRLLIGIVGVLRPFKGHEVLLRAMVEIVRAVPSAHLLIVGDGPLRQELESLSSQLTLTEHVTFAGFQEDTVPFHRAVDLYAMASIEEPFGLVTIEAMACGKAVVATASGGTVEIVEQNETGLLVRPGSAEALAEGCISLLRDPKRRQSMGKKGRQRVLEKFTLQRRADQIASALDSLARMKHAAGWYGH